MAMVQKESPGVSVAGLCLLAGLLLGCAAQSSTERVWLTKGDRSVGNGDVSTLLTLAPDDVCSEHVAQLVDLAAPCVYLEPASGGEERLSLVVIPTEEQIAARLPEDLLAGGEVAGRRESLVWLALLPESPVLLEGLIVFSVGIVGSAAVVDVYIEHGELAAGGLLLHALDGYSAAPVESSMGPVLTAIHQEADSRTREREEVGTQETGDCSGFAEELIEIGHTVYQSGYFPGHGIDYFAHVSLTACVSSEGTLIHSPATSIEADLGFSLAPDAIVVHFTNLPQSKSGLTVSVAGASYTGRTRGAADTPIDVSPNSTVPIKIVMTRFDLPLVQMRSTRSGAGSHVSIRPVFED